MSDTYHPDILYLREQECGNPWLIWKPEEVRERKGFGKVDTNYMATGLCCNVRGSNPDRENRNFPSPKRPDRLWVPKSLTFNGYYGPLLGVKREGPKFNLSPSSSAKAKNEWSCAPVQPVCLNPLAPNDIYKSRTAQLTSRRRILKIYSTNILTEYF